MNPAFVPPAPPHPLGNRFLTTLLRAGLLIGLAGPGGMGCSGGAAEGRSPDAGSGAVTSASGGEIAATGGVPGAGGGMGATGGRFGSGGRSGPGGSNGPGGSAPGSGGGPVSTSTGGRIAPMGSGGASATGGTAGGTTGGTTGGTACSTPPPAGAVVGWAAVSGRGAEGTTGGGSTPPVTVTTAAAFNASAAGTVARVIVVNGTLTGNLTIGSNKTIVGVCGAELHGYLEIKNAVNVILRNIKIVGYGAGNCALDPSYDPSVGCSSGTDAISVLGGHHIWIDHCDISDGTDGNLDITKGADLVTVSWTKFHYSPRTDSSGSDSTGASGHRFSNLVGGDDDSPVDVGALNVTWHHNWWADNVMERQPRVRYGKNHIFNNVWSGAGNNYCVRAGYKASLLLENNYFSGVKRPQEFNSTDDQATAFITATNNVYSGTTGTMATGGGGTAFTSASYPYTLDDTATLQAAVKAGAGPH